MELLFLIALSSLPAMGSLLLAARLWGKDTVIRYVRELAWSANQISWSICRRLLAALRALVAVEIDEDEMRDKILDEVEERLHNRLGREIQHLNNRVYDLDAKVRGLTPQVEDRY